MSTNPKFHDLSRTIMQDKSSRTEQQQIANSKPTGSHQVRQPEIGAEETGAECLLTMREREQMLQQEPTYVKEDYEIAMNQMRIEAQKTVEEEITKLKTALVGEISEMLKQLAIQNNPPQAELQDQIDAARQLDCRSEHLLYEKWWRSTTSSSENAPRGPTNNRAATGQITTQQRGHVGTPVDKWDIVFDGDKRNISVEDFVFRVEWLQQWNRTPWDELVKEFHRLLKTSCTT